MNDIKFLPLMGTNVPPKGEFQGSTEKIYITFGIKDKYRSHDLILVDCQRRSLSPETLLEIETDDCFFAQLC